MKPPADGRYRRQLALPEVGPAGQARLAGSRALVVGAGGLGCAALPYLVAAGLGEVVVCDGDAVEPSNLPRQVLYGDADVGRPKASVAAERLRQLNPRCRVTAVAGELDAGNVGALVAGATIVIDATDNPAARYLLHDACHAAGRPLVTAAVHHDDGQLAVFRFDRSADGPCWRCLWPIPPASVSTCEGQGILGPVPGVLGALQADQALRVLLEASPLGPGQLVHVDLASTAIWRTTWRAAPDCPLCGGGARHATAAPPPAPDADSDPAANEEIDWPGPAGVVDCLWVDARSDREHALDPEPVALAGLRLVFWREIGADGPPPEQACVVFCGHGLRSLDLVRHWRRQGCRHVASLRGGLAALRAD